MDNPILLQKDTQTHERSIIKPGGITWSWCSKHWTRTDHLYTGYKLICLECHPESKPKEEEKWVLKE